MARENEKGGVCQLCGREKPLTFHHLIPRKLHRRTHYRKHYTREELNQGIDICRVCHNGIHNLYCEIMLAQSFASLEALQADSALAKHVSWAAKQK